MKRTLQWGAAVLFLVFLGIQLIPVARTNPPVTQEIRWATPEVRAIAKRACYDCHSHETTWPWYAYVAPISWQVADHVREGREHLNFSTWDRPNDDADEIVEEVKEGEMPLWDYLLMHPEAKLTEADVRVFEAGVLATLTQDPPVDGDDQESEEHESEEHATEHESVDQGRDGAVRTASHAPAP